MRKLSVCLLAAAAMPLLAGEQVILRNGFRLSAERHEVGPTGTVRIFTSTGVIEMTQERVAGFEVEEPVAMPPSAASRARATVAAPPQTVTQADPKQLLDEAAQRYGVPAAFLHSVARTESAYRTNAVSVKGAIGVMQLMPATAAELGADPHDPAQNIDAGARHLRDLLDRYDGSAHKALSAYNAGAGAVEKYRGVPPYSETVNYVQKVLSTYQALAAARSAAVK
jgi:soluble lytic murein transglycosylase-like protein